MPQNVGARLVVEIALFVVLVNGDIGADLNLHISISWRRSPAHVVVHGDARLWIDDRLDRIPGTAERRFLAVAQEGQVLWNVVVWRQIEEEVPVTEDVVGRRVGERRVVPVEVVDEVSERRVFERKDELVDVNDDDATEAIHVAVHAVDDDGRTVQQIL